MRRLMIAVAVIAGLVGLAGLADAYTCTPTGGCTFNVQYTEPSTLTNAQPMTDLTNTTITYTLSVDGAAPGAPKTVSVPATRPQGGGAIDKAITEPSAGPPHTYTVNANATATSSAFGTSAPLTAPTKIMNNGVTSSTPSGLTIQ